MTPHPLDPSHEPPASYRRGGALLNAVFAVGIVGAGLLMLLPAVNSARQAARASQLV